MFKKKKKINPEIFRSEPWKGVKVKSRNTAHVFTKPFLRRVSVSFSGKVLDLNTNLILPGKWPRGLLAVRRALFACFALFLVQMPACSLP